MKEKGHDENIELYGPVLECTGPSIHSTIVRLPSTWKTANYPPTPEIKAAKKRAQHASD